MSKKRSSGGERQRPKLYELEMIQHFLTQLFWEVRADHFRCLQRIQNPSGPLSENRELMEQLAPYWEKYSAELLSRGEPVNEDRAFWEKRAAWRQAQIDHLEAAKSLLAEALGSIGARMVPWDV